MKSTTTTTTDTRTVVKGHRYNQLGFHLFQELLLQQENLSSKDQTKDSTKINNTVLSGLSIHIALDMLSKGATGETLNQLNTVLHQHNTNEDDQSFSLVKQELEKNGIVKLANCLFISDKFNIKPTFTNTIQTDFSSQVETVNMLNPSKTSTTINNWVSDKTNDKIKRIVQPASITSNSRLIIANAIYFKSDWKTKFKAIDTKTAPFHHPKLHDPLNVNMMHMSCQRFEYGSNDVAKWIHLPYESSDLAMILVLPNKRFDMESVEESLFSGASDGNEPCYTQFISQTENTLFSRVSLPKFKVETGAISLNSALKKLGMVNAFSSDKAEFDNICQDDDESLFVSSVCHMAFIQVDEEGTEAAAATVVRMKRKRQRVETMEFVCDEPFIFLLTHIPSSTVLFQGKIENPQ